MVICKLIVYYSIYNAWLGHVVFSSLIIIYRGLYRVLLELCIRITYEIYSSVLKPAICGLCANARVEGIFTSTLSRRIFPDNHLAFGE